MSMEPNEAAVWLSSTTFRFDPNQKRDRYGRWVRWGGILDLIEGLNEKGNTVGGQINCQRVVGTYEMRRRGDTDAVAGIGEPKDFYYMPPILTSPSGGVYGWFKDSEGRSSDELFRARAKNPSDTMPPPKYGPPTHSALKGFVERNYPVGARGSIQGTGPGKGHIFNWENTEDGAVFIDAQRLSRSEQIVGPSDQTWAGWFDWNQWNLMRLDDLEMTERGKQHAASNYEPKRDENAVTEVASRIFFDPGYDKHFYDRYANGPDQTGINKAWKYGTTVEDISPTHPLYTGEKDWPLLRPAGPPWPHLPYPTKQSDYPRLVRDGDRLVVVKGQSRIARARALGQTYPALVLPAEAIDDYTKGKEESPWVSGVEVEGEKGVSSDMFPAPDRGPEAEAILDKIAGLNPDGDTVGGKVNCQRVVATYEMRSRGMPEAVAKSGLRERGVDPVSEGIYSWFEDSKGRTQAELVRDRVIYPGRGALPADRPKEGPETFEALTNSVKENFPAPSRGWITSQGFGVGHVFNWERTKSGNVFFVDAQRTDRSKQIVGADDPMWKKGYLWGGYGLMRLDDLKMLARGKEQAATGPSLKGKPKGDDLPESFKPDPNQPYLPEWPDEEGGETWSKSAKEAIKRTEGLNPHANTPSGQSNCQRTTAAYEMRLRGMTDAVAKTTSPTMDKGIWHWFKDDEGRTGVSLFDARMIMPPIEFGEAGTVDTYGGLTKWLTTYPVPSSGCIAMRYDSTRKGHVFNWQNTPDGVIFIDAQEKDPDKRIVGPEAPIWKSPWNGYSVMRLDDLKMTRDGMHRAAKFAHEREARHEYGRSDSGRDHEGAAGIGVEGPEARTGRGEARPVRRAALRAGLARRGESVLARPWERAGRGESNPDRRVRGTAGGVEAVATWLSSTQVFKYDPGQLRGRDGKWITEHFPYDLTPDKSYVPPGFVEQNLTPELKAHVEGAMTQFTKEVQRATPIVSMSERALIHLIRDKKFKTAWNHGAITERSFTGNQYMTARRKFETHNLGIPEEVDAAERPISGWLQRPNSRKENDPAGMIDESDYWVRDTYGDIDVELKEEVKGRSTVSMGDSLNENSFPVKISDLPHLDPLTFAGAGYDKAWRERLMDELGAEAAHRQIESGGPPEIIDALKQNLNLPQFQNPDLALDSVNYGWYDEFQVYGGLTTDDIEVVTFPHLPMPLVQDLLEANGIRWEIRDVSSESIHDPLMREG